MSDIITPESLNEQQERIEYGQQEFKDNFKYKLFKNESNELYLLFDYMAGGLTTDTKIETVFEQTNIGITLLKSGTFVFEQINDMTTFENEIIEYLENYTNDITKIYVKNYSDELKYLIDFSLIDTMSKSCPNIEIDIKNSSIELESNGSLNFDSFYFNTGNLLVDRSFILTSDNITVNQMYVNSYNDRLADCIFNMYTSKSINITSLFSYSATKINIICDNTDASTYTENILNINYYNIYGKEFVLSDISNSRLSIKGFYKCYIDTIEIEDDVSYGSILHLDLLDYVFIGNVIRNISTIQDGRTILVKNVSKITIGESHINITENSNINNDSSFIDYYGTENADKKIILNNINIQNDTDNSFTFFNIKGESITKLLFSNITINKNVLLFDVFKKDTSSVLKANFSYIDITGGDSLYISNCDMLTISNCNLNLNTIELNTKQMNIIDCDIISKNILLTNNNLTKCTINNSTFTSEHISIYNKDTELQPKIYLKKSRFFISNTFIIENVVPSIVNSFLQLSSIYIKNDSFCKCNEVILEPREQNILFDCYTSFNGYFSLSVKKDYSIIFNIIDDNKSFVRNTLDISSSDETISGRSIELTTNYPISTVFDKCLTSVINITLNKSDELDETDSIFKTTIPSQKYLLTPNKYYDLISVISEEGSDYTTYSTKNK